MRREKIQNDIEPQTLANPDKRLWYAVYGQAVREACGTNEKVASAARRWLTQPNSEKETGGVLWVCDVTGITFHRIVLRVIKYGTPEEKQELKKALT